MADSFLRQFRNNFVANRLGRRRNVMDRNDQEVFGRTRRRDNREELRGHSRGHFAQFSTPLRLSTRAKGGSSSPLLDVGLAARGAFILASPAERPIHLFT